MTIPLWLPFALLAAWCAVYPAPSWMRRLAGLDWTIIVAWALVVLGSLAVWAVFSLVILTLAGVL